MKKLFLLRHAKSSWKDLTLDDIERPLNKRGKQDALFMAEKFLEKKIFIDLIIASSSRRTADTAQTFAQILGLKSNVILTEKLYAASTNTILNLVLQFDEAVANVILVAHNPGITELSNELSDFYIDNIPTTGIIGFAIEGSWKNVCKQNSTFLFFNYPKLYLKN